ncbi:MULTISPECIES: GyrI-like domain-containing protein [Flavobacterium]|uniref:AraC effector-binding domain-containing protein n=1 Tax=Flavobacterium hankyongi TaxID=1176532 RepID=A0ABP9A4S4_9FLAO|nr:GyrI-like domain-containing protein [Flavobacterium sp. N1846]
MEFKIIDIQPKKLIGKSLSMSFLNNATGVLWASFAPSIKEIKNRVGGERVSLQFYGDDFMKNPSIPFTKWATVEVSNFDEIPSHLEKLELNAGLYAVFHYKGNVVQAASYFKNIFTEWIPASEYEVDNSRPHFEILPIGKYDPMDENSEEDIYIPIKLKK